MGNQCWFLASETASRSITLSDGRAGLLDRMIDDIVEIVFSEWHMSAMLYQSNPNWFFFRNQTQLERNGIKICLRLKIMPLILFIIFVQVPARREQWFGSEQIRPCSVLWSKWFNSQWSDIYSWQFLRVVANNIWQCLSASDDCKQLCLFITILCYAAYRDSSKARCKLCDGIVLNSIKSVGLS